MGTVNEPLEPRLGAAKAESFSRTRQRSALWPSCRSTFRHLARGRQVAKLTRRVVGLEPARRVPVASCAFGGLYLAGILIRFIASSPAQPGGLPLRSISQNVPCPPVSESPSHRSQTSW
jgi:hypothetical protein